ncbi:MAG: PstS family phosphate ABC transporter substrate-binding protein [Oligoflexia bacterium]|nr:PstS family phosphate ABC transporter substrate-binding protein [Oligoflexia bacterium]
MHTLPFILATLGLFACSQQSPSNAPPPPPTEGPKPIVIGGSSTVFPITEAVAKAFQFAHNRHVSTSVSGTSTALKKLCEGDLAIIGASRPINQAELAQCEEHGVSYIELPIAYDGIAVVVNPEARWVDKLSVAELKTMWEPAAQDKIMKWSQMRTGWPDEDLRLFGPSADSGTYDYFTKAIVGEEHSSRSDYINSENHAVLVAGVSADRLALGFVGLAYFKKNTDKLRIVPIDDGNDADGAGAIAPTSLSVADGSYQPLTRPLFLYVNAEAAARPEVQNFIHFYLNEGRPAISNVGYIRLSDAAYKTIQARFDQRTTGTLFGGEGSRVGASVEDLLTTK